MHVGSITYKTASVFFVVSLGLLLALPRLAFAGETQNSGGITVAPASVMLDLAKGAKAQDAAVSVRNNTATTMHFSATVHGVQQGAGGVLVPSDKPEADISGALQVGQQDFILGPGQSINIKISVTDSGGLGPGGHYATLLIREVADVAHKVAITQAVSVMIFVTKEDGATKRLTVNSIVGDGTIFSIPHSVTATYSNEGNTELTPRASIKVHDPIGREVMTGIANEASVMVFPQHQVRLRTYLKALATAWVPGRYRMEVTYRFDGSDRQQTNSVTRWVLPPLFLAVLAVFLLALAVLARFVWLIWPWVRLKIKGKPKDLPHEIKTAPRKSMDIIVRRRR